VSETPNQILRRHGLHPKKSWGQNFLGDDHILSAIARACTLAPGMTAVELGAGLGHFTRQLAASGANIVAIERDRELVAVLEKELALPNVRVVAANAAELDFAEVAGTRPVAVVGNLPYHLSSTITFAVLHQRANVSYAVFLLQREVAERLAAGPGSRDYGLLSVLLQLYAEVEVVLEVPRGAFFPPPKVESSVVRIDFLPRPRAEVTSDARFEKLVKAAFQQRRKTLANALEAGGFDARPALAAAGIDGIRRAETLSPAEFAAVERSLGPAPGSPP
jgi:16S rRNA (adenine1518-N6/adenine1519-N6)-dimethyltransferase